MANRILSLRMGRTPLEHADAVVATGRVKPPRQTARARLEWRWVLVKLGHSGLSVLSTSCVTPVLGAEDDPNLSPESLDAVLLVDVYHELAHPFEIPRWAPLYCAVCDLALRRIETRATS